jgi:hypothetical protein
MLPDEVLLEIFHSCINQGQDAKEEAKSWQLLIHVCRRWRIIVFGSPRRLNLRLFCTPQTPADDTLGIWPALPLLIQGSISSESDAVNTTTMLNYSDRMCTIDFEISPSQYDCVLAAMQKPFPELTELRLGNTPGLRGLVLPDSFLVGSAPRLRVLSLFDVRNPFPGLPRLLLSATHLVALYLKDSSRYGSVSPQAIATALPALTRLETLGLELSQFGPDFDEDDQLPPPSTRSVLPALTRLTFRGYGEDLEILKAQLDTPLLNRLSVTFFNPDHIHFYTTQLARFIDHAPRFRANDEANIVFFDSDVTVKLASRVIGHESPVVSIRTKWSVSTLAHICTSFPPLSTVGRLYIYEIGHVDAGEAFTQQFHWLEILSTFAAVKNIYISQLFAPRIVSKLQELVGGGAEVLPFLQNIFIEGLRQSGLIRELFAAARQRSGRGPINISHWNRLKDLEQDNFQDDDGFK